MEHVCFEEIRISFYSQIIFF
jgi:hypothetical protein